MQPAGFAHIEFMRPIVGFRELVGVKAVLAHALAQRFRNRRIVCKKIHESLLIVDMVLKYLFALGIRTLCPAEISPNIVY